MSEKRRDSKNRILKTGESQRKDGRYAYKFIDNLGKAKFVYSWRLVETDKTPSGKKHDISLREKEKLIKKDLEDGIICDVEKPLIALLEEFIVNKKNLKISTREIYNAKLAGIKRYKISRMKIKDIKIKNVQDFCREMYRDGLLYGTITGYKAMLHNFFNDAVVNDIVRKDPTNFKLSSIIHNNSNKRNSLSFEDENKFLEFIRQDEMCSKYYNAIYILFNTGLRISELCGLTEKDIDFEKQVIKVRKQIIRVDKKLVVLPPKSKAGIRDIPMTKEVCNKFKEVIKERKNISKVEQVIGGYSKFIFINTEGFPKDRGAWERTFQRICTKYNKLNKDKLLKVTPHICRHTFCTKIIHNGLSPKSSQYIMGHSDINMTMNVYTHSSAETAIDEFNKINII